MVVDSLLLSKCLVHFATSHDALWIMAVGAVKQEKALCGSEDLSYAPVINKIKR